MKKTMWHNILTRPTFLTDKKKLLIAIDCVILKNYIQLLEIYLNFSSEFNLLNAT